MIKNISEHLSKNLGESRLLKKNSIGILEQEDTERIFCKDSPLVAKNLLPEVKAKYLEKESRKPTVPIMLLQRSQSKYIKRGNSTEESPSKFRTQIKTERSLNKYDLPLLTEGDKDNQSRLYTYVDFFEMKPLPDLKKEKKSDMQDMTLVATNSRKLVVQPKCFEERGTMCVSELWSDREKATIGYQKKEQILDVNKLPVVQDDKFYLSIYRPNKMEKESREKRQLIKKHLIGISQQLKIDTHLLAKKFHQNGQSDPKRKNDKKVILNSLTNRTNSTNSYTKRDTSRSKSVVKFREPTTSRVSYNSQVESKQDQPFSIDCSNIPSRDGTWKANNYNKISENNQNLALAMRGFLSTLETERNEDPTDIDGMNTKSFFHHRTQSLASITSDPEIMFQKRLKRQLQESMAKISGIQDECENFTSENKKLEETIVKAQVDFEKKLNKLEKRTQRNKIY